MHSLFIKNKKKSCRNCLVLLSLLLLSNCQSSKNNLSIQDYEIAVRWADMALYIAKNTPSNSPTFASRGFGYIGFTMYESVVHSSEQKQSLAGQLNKLDALPQPDKSKKYNWVLSLNAGQAFILKNIYQQTSDENKEKIDSLEKVIQNTFKEAEADEQVAARSVAYGRAVASAIFEWSKNDGGHRGYLNNFESEINMPTDKGSWKAPYFAQTISRFPLHPSWGNNRTFIKANKSLEMPQFIHYQKTKNCAYYKQFAEVYDVNKKLSQEQKEIAMWWNDDPSETFTPPGHSFNLASIVLKTKKADLITCAETYARVGIAVADAFITCWKMKYYFFTERPSSFISENIDAEWESFWPDPPFPAFPSGHAMQASAVATVLADFYGDKMNIVDDTHSSRPKDEIRNVEYKKRNFTSFWQVAEETAYSRFLGGIHTNQDNLIGLQEGAHLGKNINSLSWNKKIFSLVKSDNTVR